MNLLKIENLTKFYGDFKALDNVSMTIKKNEVYGFIGRNGAGKTTTINIVLSFLSKDSGQVFFEDQEIGYDDIRYKERIGYVPDVPSFPKYMTAKEFLRFAYDSYGLDSMRRDERIKEVFSIIGLEDNTKRIGGFSRGMKQRLAIGQALLHKPVLLIMDEPTSALDPLGRKDVIDIIRSLKKDMTVFYSTHILEDSQKVCDRIGLIDNGKMLFEDSMDKIIKKHHAIAHYIKTDLPVDLLIKLLNDSKLVSDVSLYEDGVIYTLNNIDDAKIIQKTLIDQDVEIITYKEQERTLEDVFIEVLNENHH